MPQGMLVTLVSPGTLVSSSDAVKALPKPMLWLLKKLNRALHIPDPDRLIADVAYAPLKRECAPCRVFPLVGLGLADRAKSVEAFKAEFRKTIQYYVLRGIEPRFILVGQSQGALVVAEVALDPEFSEWIVAVVMAGGPFCGSPVAVSEELGWAAKVFPGVAQMVPEHPTLEVLRENVFTRWPKEILPIMIGNDLDELVKLDSALGLEFPEGVDAQYIELCSKMPASQQKGRQYREVYTRRGMHHVLMCRDRGFLGIVIELQKKLRKAPHRRDLQAA